ncbi:hypothetical protein HHX48_16290 [Salinimonas sp. HHU 13199]|uniref:Prepilin peptidase dependent protein B n=1 Tax=Salinimonas profundi TaxID=2729140 RepID=A0ABR8LM55_9ALTE|nr:hypothetical protein [Salinimonas profundi]MBD3587296.1 hypothetical protein [Salinimonas profundi]
MLSRGYTLTGLLMSMGIGVSLLAAGATFAMNLSQQQLVISQKLELQNHVKRTGLLIMNELSRAGYDGMAGIRFISGIPRDASPFYPAFELGVSGGYSQGSCVVFHYDKNHNGTIEKEPLSEYLGFRLKDGAIESRMDAKDCDQPGWQDLTDPTYIKVDTFRISPVNISGSGALLSVEISATLVRAPSVSAKLHWPVTVRNF